MSTEVEGGEMCVCVEEQRQTKRSDTKKKKLTSLRVCTSMKIHGVVICCLWLGVRKERERLRGSRGTKVYILH